MSIKTAVGIVLKAMRKARGLSQKDLAEVSSRTYVSKLERGQSSPTLEMMSTLSAPLNLSPLTLVAITIGTESGRPLMSVIRQMEDEIVELAAAGVLQELNIPLGDSMPANPQKHQPRLARALTPDRQTEFCFAD